MSGGRNKGGPKHQNKTAYKIQFNPLALEIHKKVSLRGLCKRCADQITWKMQYNKYKKMSEPAKCSICSQKNVLRSYMAACQPCAESLKMCPKCLDLLTEDEVEVRLNQIEQKKQDEESERKMNDYVKTLKERSRRTVKRLFQKGTIKWSPELNTFVDEEGEAMTLQFRQGYGDKNTLNGGDDEEDIDEFGDDDDEENEEDEEEEEVKSKKSKSKDKAPKKDGKHDVKAKPASKPSDNEENQDDDDDEENEEDQEEGNEENDDNEDTCTKVKQAKPKAKTIPKQKAVKAQELVVLDGDDQDWQDEQGEQQEQEEPIK